MDGNDLRRTCQSVSANGSPVCSEKKIKVELSGLIELPAGKSMAASGEMSLPGIDPQVTLNVVAFTVAFPTPELAWRMSKMVGPINPGELNWSLDKRGSTGAVTFM